LVEVLAMVLLSVKEVSEGGEETVLVAMVAREIVSGP
jgi:hypothetical protein